MTPSGHTLDNIDLFLAHLSADDAFRQQLIERPLETFGTVGIAIDATRIPAIRTLPSKQIIAANRALIKDRLQGQCAMALFFLSNDDLPKEH